MRPQVMSQTAPEEEAINYTNPVSYFFGMPTGKRVISLKDTAGLLFLNCFSMLTTSNDIMIQRLFQASKLNPGLRTVVFLAQEGLIAFDLGLG
jgi:hypothetical protein